MSTIAEFVREYRKLRRMGLSRRNAWRWAKDWVFLPVPF